ncbi:MAG: hypothetical protein E7557_01330 [Ruminococcaceae bacterium]|nr:hypothetical protein [Oscillospiraceae bacterium]
MTSKNKIKQIITGIFSSAIVWSLSILLSGVIVGGDLLELGYSELGLGKIFFILFLGYNIFIAFYSTKTNNRYYWKSAFITEIIPLISLLVICILEWAHLTGTFIFGFSFMFCIPAGSILCMFPDSPISTIISTIIIAVSPIISLVIYKIKSKG